MSNSSNETYSKTLGVLNSCQNNVIIPALIEQMGKIAKEEDRNTDFDAEYGVLLEKFNTHFETNLTLEQLHTFLSSKPQ